MDRNSIRSGNSHSGSLFDRPKDVSSGSLRSSVSLYRPKRTRRLRRKKRAAGGLTPGSLGSSFSTNDSRNGHGSVAPPWSSNQVMQAPTRGNPYGAGAHLDSPFFRKATSLTGFQWAMLYKLFRFNQFHRRQPARSIADPAAICQSMGNRLPPGKGFTLSVTSALHNTVCSCPKFRCWLWMTT